MNYNEKLVHPLYRPLIKTGLKFGVQRWMASLQRQSEFSLTMKSFIDPTRDHAGPIIISFCTLLNIDIIFLNTNEVLFVIVCYNAKRSIEMLSQCMTYDFGMMICAPTQE